MKSDTYYDIMAYDSSRVGTLPPINNSQRSYTIKSLRNKPLTRFTTAQCGEFISSDNIEIIELLNSKDKEVLSDIASHGHEIQPWETLRNPKAVVEIISGVSYFLSLPAWTASILLIVLTLFKRPDWLADPKFLFYLISIPGLLTIIYKSTKYIANSGRVEDKNNIILNRRKGTIRCPSKSKPNQEIPFEEFDPYLNHSASSSGRIGYHLTLHHRYSEEWISYPDEMEDEWQVNQAWEFWQQYMDVSKPLPDTPRMEPFRSRDPVTAEYDKKHDRPPDYWKKMDMGKADRMQNAAMVAASKYPLGATREQALKMGWRPSGVGEGDWKVSSE